MSTLHSLFCGSSSLASQRDMRASRGVQEVLDLPELKIVKPSDTRRLAHEKCVTNVKRCCDAIVTTLEFFFEESHEPDALGMISRILKKAVYFVRHLPS